jgi:hypothetical protein
LEGTFDLVSRLTYRVNQFCRALRTPAGAVDTAQISPYLPPAQIALFRQMQPFEQQHAARVMQRLRNAGQTHADLLAAALLHDVGKILYPLAPLERAVIVLGRKFFPRLASRWGEGTPRGLRRAFVVSERHAAWGADLAARAGVSARAVRLIRLHQDPAEEDPLLRALQEADDSN